MDKCSDCKKAFNSASKPRECAICKQRAHSSCLTPVRQGDESGISKVCRACLTAANPLSASGAHLSPSDLTHRRSNSGGSASSTSSHGSGKPDQMSEDLLTVLTSIKNTLTVQCNKIESIETNVSSINNRLGAIEQNVSAIGDRVKDVETQVVALQADMGDIRSDLDSHIEQTAKSLQELQSADNPESTAANPRVQALEEANSALSQEVQQLKMQHSRLAHASELVVGGLQISELTDLKKAVFSVLNVVDPTFNFEDIVSARPLSRISIVPASDEQSSSSNNNNVTPAPPSSTPLIVTLRTASLAKQLLHDKITKGKIVTTQIPSELAEEAGLIIIPSDSQTININEFLPKNVFTLKRLAYKKSRDKRFKNKFTVFMRDGCIFVRRKNSDVSVPITSTSDLDNFLGTLGTGLDRAAQ